MDTTTLTIALPEPLRAFVDGQVAARGYRDAGDYIQALLREAQKHQAREKVEALLREGLQSPVSEMTAADWDEIRREALERLATQEVS